MIIRGQFTAIRVKSKPSSRSLFWTRMAICVKSKPSSRSFLEREWPRIAHEFPWISLLLFLLFLIIYGQFTAICVKSKPSSRSLFEREWPQTAHKFPWILSLRFRYRFAPALWERRKTTFKNSFRFIIQNKYLPLHQWWLREIQT